MRDDELRKAILDYIEHGDAAIIHRAADTLDPLDDDSNPTPLGWAVLHAQAELDTGLVADGAIRRTLVEALISDAYDRAAKMNGLVKSGSSGIAIMHQSSYPSAMTYAVTTNDRLRLRRIFIEAFVKSALRTLIVGCIIGAALYLAASAVASPRVTPAQAERAAASWTRWYWSAANEDMGGGYTVNDLAVTCERTPQSTRRFVRCAATYNVTDPTDSSADLGSFEDFHRVCTSRRVNKARHAIAAPDARIARTTLLVRRKRDGSGVVLDCKYVSFREGRYS